MSEAFSTIRVRAPRFPRRTVRPPRAEPANDDVFAPFRRAEPDRPFVVAQLGQSLDGRIATVTGESQWINGDSALNHLHKIRANVDAVVIGIGTATIDDPALTVRRVAGENPARVVLDPGGKLSGTARCMADDGAQRIVVGKRSSTLPDDVECIEMPDDEERRICPREIVARLYRQGFSRILIEGGAWTISRFIQAGAIDRLHMLVAPMIIGSGKPGIDLEPIRNLGQALRPKSRAYPLEDGEVLFDCNLRSCGAT